MLYASTLRPTYSGAIYASSKRICSISAYRGTDSSYTRVQASSIRASRRSSWMLPPRLESPVLWKIPRVA